MGASAGAIPATVEPQGVDLDGQFDYFSRTSDLVGNVDSKVFTFSCWVYLVNLASGSSVIYKTETSTLNSRFSVYISSSGSIVITGWNSTGSIILSVTASAIPLQNFSFNSIIISIDLSNASNRFLVLNGTVQGGATWATYTNDLISFTEPKHTIGNIAGIKNRLSNIFLDYTYRDLSIEANRRLFIDANGKPADGWKALNPIIGMSMKDAATAHINDFGTGGNFTPNGTFATSNRGANQDNCVASYFNGNTQYLSRTSLTGVADGKQFTFSCNVKCGDTIENQYIFATGTTSSYHIAIAVTTTLSVEIKNAIGVTIVSMSAALNSTFAAISHTITFSFDLSDTAKRSLYVDGKVKTASWGTYTDSDIDFTSTNYNIARLTHFATFMWKGDIGELYFNTTYEPDLSIFWDSVENKPKPVRQVIRETGVIPLIASPLDASNPTTNYGSGGAWILNGGGLVGARGASEVWARSAKFDGTTGYLEKTGMTATFPNSSMLLCACKYSSSAGNVEIRDMSGVTYGALQITCNSVSIGYSVTRTNGGTNGYSYSATTTDWNIVALIVDWTTTTNNVKLWVNGVNVATQSYDTLGIPTGSSSMRARVGNVGSELAMCYFPTASIDFSQEVNRLKFVDAFNMPLDLAKQIESGAIPTPLIYLPFDEPTNLGKNLGTGGAFSVVGTVTSGPDVNG